MDPTWPNEASRCPTVLVIGSGFGGQAATLALRDAGVHDVTILERRDTPGGTWIQNTYPGAAVDVQSPLYSLSDEPWDWTRMFAEQDELADYTRHVLDKHRLHDHIVLGAEVVSVTWDEDAARWRVETAERGTFEARFVVNASGPLSQPSVPDFPGRDTFAGPAWHTNAWRHDVDLTGKRVGVIGFGASAAQVIPALAPEVEHLHVFMRTPHWVMPRPDHHFSPWERRLLRWRPAYLALRWAIYWSLESRVVGFKYVPSLLARFGRVPALRHLEAQVPDPALRDKLTPDYELGCKRVILSNTLYPALGRDDVSLHDRSEAISAITPTGIDLTNGEHVALDALVYATGYRVSEGSIPYPVVGRDGVDLEQAWSPFARAYLGTTMPGFPNLFVVTGPNTGIGHTSALFIIESQMRYLTRCVRAVLDAPQATIEPTPEAEAAYTSWIHDEMEQTVWRSGGCTSWYQSADGHVIAMFPGFSFTYWRWAGRFRPGHHRVA